MIIDNEYDLFKIIESVQFWQNDNNVHSLTCEKHHKLIVSYIDNEIFLYCPHCNYKQNVFPFDIIISYYRNRHKYNCLELIK